MPPDYLAVLTASYDYEAQSDDEISITEGQLLLLLEKVDDEWWKVKIKAAQEAESPVGLVPAAYVEQAEHTSTVRTLYDYEATAPGELSVVEDEVLYVFETEDDWLLVQHSTDAKAGYVPGNYVEVVDENAPTTAPPAAAPLIIVPDSPPRPVAPYVDPADRVAQSRGAASTPAAADEIKTWAVSEVDKKGKKKKGTLGVGNGNVYFASESDKTPVQKWQTKDLDSVVSEKAKLVRLDIGGAVPVSLHFHAGSKDHAEAIIAKLELSKSLASPPTTATSTDSPPPEASKKATVHFSNASPVIIPEPEEEEEEEEEEEHEEPAPRQTTTYAPPPRLPPSAPRPPIAAPEPEEDGEEVALALYDFTADGEDELSVTEGERLVVLEKDGDEWWKCRNESGGEGVVPASYLESVPGTAKTPASKAKAATTATAPGAAAAAAAAARAAEARRSQAEADAQAEAEAEAEAERERLKAEEAAAEARKQRARKAEAQEKAKQAAMAAEAQRKQRVEANTRASSPPAAQQSSRSKDPRASSAAGSTTSKTSSDMGRPPPEKTRVWHDRSGQFRVEAAFLGFNNGKLRLHKVNGVIVEVPSEKMSVEDMQYVERFLEKASRARPGSGVPRISDDDIPLALGRNSSSADGASKAARAAQQQPPKKKGPTIDWFDFFLSAGCDIDDCTRYAAAFERDKLDEALLADITESTMRSLGLREGDILRVKKAVARRAPGENLAKPSAHLQEQLRRDEELARQLQAQEGGGKAPHLFADASGVLKPRRGRPTAKTSVPANVDIKAISGASDQIQRTASPMSSQSPASVAARAVTPVLSARPASAANTAPLISGFEDDAWTNRPSSTKPIKAISPPPAAAAAPTPAPAPAPVPTPTVAATPPVPAPSAPPSLANRTESDIFEQLAKLSQMRTANSAPPRPTPTQQQLTPSPAFNMAPPAGYATGMGVGPSPVPMGHFSPPPQQQPQQPPPQPYNGPRGPFAPVATNQSLLQPLIPVPTQPTGIFIPTKAPMNGGSPFGSGTMLSQPSFLSSQPTGFAPQQPQQLMSQPTGFGNFTPSPQPMMGQPTGFNPGAQQPMMAQQTGAYGGFGGSPFGNQNQGQNGSGFSAPPLQSQMTGFRPPLNQSMFGPGPASPPPVPPLPSNLSQNTSPANVFAQMKSGNFASDNDNQHSAANTGLNGQTPAWGQTYQGYTGY